MLPASWFARSYFSPAMVALPGLTFTDPVRILRPGLTALSGAHDDPGHGPAPVLLRLGRRRLRHHGDRGERAVFGVPSLASGAGAGIGPWVTGVVHDLTRELRIRLLALDRLQRGVGRRDMAGGAAQGPGRRRARVAP